MRQGAQRWFGVLTWALLCLACEPAFAADELVFAVSRSPLSLPIYVAEAEGYFKAEGAPVRIVDCPFGRICLKQMLDGQAQLATVADSPIVFASFTTDRLRILATLGTTRSENKIVTRKASNIRAPADLAGRKVGTLVGTSAHYLLDSAATLAGVDPSRVNVVPMQSDKMAAALAGGEVDALALFEPFAYNVMRSLGDQGVVLPTLRAYEQTWNLVAAQSLVPARDRDLTAVIRALDRADAFIHREPAKARAILRQRLGLDEAALDWMWDEKIYSLNLEQSLLNTLEGQARWALRNGHVSGKAPNYLSLVHAAPLASVRPKAVTIKY